MSQLPYKTLSSALRERFGERIQKITIDAGMTCPNRDGTSGRGGCIYCNDNGSGTGAHTKGLSITEQIESAKSFLGRRYKAKKFIAYFQSYSNTYGPAEKLRELYEEALSVDGIVGLSIGTRPDCVPDEILDMIADLNRETWITIEYGLQSIHDDTLKQINRGHSSEDFRDAVRRTRERGIDVCVHIILGLPGEDKEAMLATAHALSKMHIQAVKVHLCYVIRGTALHDLFERGGYAPMTRDDYIDVVSDFLAILPPNVIIHRLTGDPHREELVAPLWAMEKETNIRLIRETLMDRGIYQGMLYMNNEKV